MHAVTSRQQVEEKEEEEKEERGVEDITGTRDEGKERTAQTFLPTGWLPSALRCCHTRTAKVKQAKRFSCVNTTLKVV